MVEQQSGIEENEPESRADFVEREDTLRTDEERENARVKKIKRLRPLHNLLMKKGIPLSSQEIPPAVSRLYTILRSLFWKTYDIERGYVKLDEFEVFDGLGLTNTTSEQKKAFLTQLLEDEEVKTAIFPKQ